MGAASSLQFSPARLLIIVRSGVEGVEVVVVGVVVDAAAAVIVVVVGDAAILLRNFFAARVMLLIIKSINFIIISLTLTLTRTRTLALLGRPRGADDDDDSLAQANFRSPARVQVFEFPLAGSHGKGYSLGGADSILAPTRPARLHELRAPVWL